MLRFYTDYPFVTLGDVSGYSAPIREVELISWDHDKYVTVDVILPSHERHRDSVKAGYIYSEYCRFGDDYHKHNHAKMSDIVWLAIKKLPTTKS